MKTMKSKRWTATVLFGLVALTMLSCAKDETDTRSAASPLPAATQASTSSSLTTLAAAQKSCGYTAEATTGPYYVSGTRALTDGNVNYDDLDGTPVKIGGYVYGSAENSSPISGARIEIWHADDGGAYHPQDQGAVSDFPADDVSLRGYVTTNDKGYYEFSSIFPGEYEGRVRHIHVRAEADGHQPKISQIITALPGDQISPDNDNIAASFPSCNIVSFTDRDGVKTAVFNFHLQ